MAQITFEDLAAIREEHRDQKIVFCSGCFDLTHAGHLLFFEDCKKLGDVLVVMVGSDEVIRRDKGAERPILNESVRMKLIDALKPVDYVLKDKIVFAGSHPLLYIDHVLGELKPEKYVINRDAFNIPYREAFVKKHGVELVILERTCPPEFENISTSGIIKKIQQFGDGARFS